MLILISNWVRPGGVLGRTKSPDAVSPCFSTGKLSNIEGDWRGRDSGELGDFDGGDFGDAAESPSMVKFN